MVARGPAASPGGGRRGGGGRSGGAGRDRRGGHHRGADRAQASVVALSGGGFGTSGASSRPGGRTVIAERPARAGVGAGRVRVSHSGELGVPGGQFHPCCVAGHVPVAGAGTILGVAVQFTVPLAVAARLLLASAGPGTLQVTPSKLTLSAAAGKAVSGTFIVTAVGGPVNSFTISSANANVTVSPSSGSLGSAGAWVAVTVTATARSHCAPASPWTRGN